MKIGIIAVTAALVLIVFVAAFGAEIRAFAVKGLTGEAECIGEVCQQCIIDKKLCNCFSEECVCEGRIYPKEECAQD